MKKKANQVDRRGFDTRDTTLEWLAKRKDLVSEAPKTQGVKFNSKR